MNPYCTPYFVCNNHACRYQVSESAINVPSFVSVESQGSWCEVEGSPVDKMKISSGKKFDGMFMYMYSDCDNAL